MTYFLVSLPRYEIKKDVCVEKTLKRKNHHENKIKYKIFSIFVFKIMVPSYIYLARLG